MAGVSANETKQDQPSEKEEAPKKLSLLGIHKLHKNGANRVEVGEDYLPTSS
ncbi:hypothetical protein ACFL6C_12535 [Myxococcota bacterium]